MVDQPKLGTNTSYLIDFIQITYSAKLLNSEEVRDFYIKRGLSAAQIAAHFGVAKSVILGRLHDFGIRPGPGMKRAANPENYRCHVPPYGFALKGGKLVPHRGELRICRIVVELIGRQGLAATAVAKELTRRGYKNRAGKSTWDHKTIQSIFKRWTGKL